MSKLNIWPENIFVFNFKNRKECHKLNVILFTTAYLSFGI